jgi:short subunit dehydrogenase-like uncharacterized protein
MSRYLIYGATGYTGGLIAQLARERGEHPILAGRNAAGVGGVAAALGLEHRAFGLDRVAEVRAGLEGVAAVLHCAGPFAHTFQTMAEACLQSKVHYLDVTGEVSVFEALAARDGEARAAGVMLLPGVGFDVVPSDCLAVHLKRRLPGATHLTLGFQGLGETSRGTANTVVENLHRGGLVRRHGVLTPVPAAWRRRTIDFGSGPRPAVTIPWGDVSTAYHSTGIPNIEVYMAAPRAMALGMRLGRPLLPLLAKAPIQRLLKRRILAGPPGPDAETRARGGSRLWGEVRDQSGGRAAARLAGPDGYTLTAHTALLCLRRVLAGDAPPGFQTPAKAYGPDLVLEVPGTVRSDE